jgi:hypothetical protein
MATISLFTSINYARPRSCAEGALSILSNYFYLGGKRAIVVRGDEVRLEVGKVSWYRIALKVASYMLLFPLTLTLLAINLGLRSQYNFTLINSSQPRQDSPDSALKNRLESPLSSIQLTDVDHSIGLEENRGAKVKEEILDTLTKCANREESAFLIDFSKVNPTNIFKIFNKGSHRSSVYGDVGIDDRIPYDESDKFIHDFPFKFSIDVVTLEKNEHGFNTRSGCMFTMNDEGKIESYGEVFDNFDLYLEYFMKKRFYSFSFEHLDFHSVWNNNEYKKLRKKSSVPY